MRPILFHLGPIPIYSYGLLVASGVLVAIYFLGKEAPRVGISRENIVDATLWFTVSSFMGARIFYVIQNWGYYSGRPLEILMIWKGGVVFYGGAIGSLLFLLFYCRFKMETFLTMTDLLAPFVFLTHSFGRVGCFLNGCCYGKVARVPWAVHYPFLEDPVHPTQLYESAFNLMGFAVLFVIQRRKKFLGETSLSYFLIYGSGRFILEYWRGDNVPVFVGLTLPQIFSVFFILLASFFYLFYFRRLALRKT